jgi:hypothetical protein
MIRVNVNQSKKEAKPFLSILSPAEKTTRTNNSKLTQQRHSILLLVEWLVGDQGEEKKGLLPSSSIQENSAT